MPGMLVGICYRYALEYLTDSPLRRGRRAPCRAIPSADFVVHHVRVRALVNTPQVSDAVAIREICYARDQARNCLALSGEDLSKK